MERHPIILPKGKHITGLIIDFYHRKSHHQGHRVTLKAVRAAGFSIIHGPSQVKRHIKECVLCRRLHADGSSQRMADLPEESGSPGLFLHVGMDVFGPYHIKFKRSSVKRYRLIFTCLSSRSIHLEPLADMSTDRFINALRRFLNRRGQVKSLWCDRGTNFVGASNEVSGLLKAMNEGKVKDTLAKEYGAEYFRFGYPFSSHKNGHVERQIRTVKSVLHNILFEHKDKLDDDTFSTFLAEVEGIVNSRPLSVQDLNNPDTTLIAPINLSTQKSSIVNTFPGHFTERDVHLRQTYCQVQFLSDVFWQRWRREYLQGLQRRNFHPGDIVLVKDTSQSRNNWPLAHVEETVVETDGLVRKATVRIHNKLFDHSCNHLVLMIPIEEQ